MNSKLQSYSTRKLLYLLKINLCFSYFYVMNKNEIIKILKEEEKFIQNEFGVISIGLFGSYAKQTEHINSDVDLLVEFKEPSYSYLMGLYQFLESKINSKIEIVRKGPHLSKRFLDTIKKDLIYV